MSWTQPAAEYAKDTKLKVEDVQVLLEWCKKQPHLPEITELQVIFFLHCSFYRLEAAKVVIDKYFTIKTICPEFFTCPTLQILKKTLSAVFISILPERTDKDEAVLITKLLKNTPEDFDVVQQVRSVTMTMDFYQHKQGTAGGSHLVMDWTNVGIAHVAKMNLGVAKKFIYYIQEAAPIRVGAVHMINATPAAEKFIYLLRSFLKKGVFNLFHFHKNLDTLHDFIPKKILPAELGGTYSTISALHEKHCSEIFSNLDFFNSLDLQKVDETKRPEKSHNLDDIFGTEGTFKKLNVD